MNLRYASLLVFCCIGSACAGQDVESADKDYSSELPRIAPLTPEQALQEFDILDGFEVQLVACEPLVTSPVAFAFNAKGQLWVVEMRDYSEQDTERLGRVALLTDTDGDGVMDQRTTFAENLSWPTAIWPWLDGVLVAEPPHLTWFRDTDGDGVADESEVWFTGFGRSNVQGLVNSLRWGVDAWIHGVTSSTGAKLDARTTGQTIDLGRRDFAIDPISKSLRPESGGGQHGMSFNRWGEKFVTSNSDHLQQIIDMESWLSKQRTSVTFPDVRRSIAQDGPQAEVFRVSPVEPWRVVRTRLRVSGVAPGIIEGGGRAAGYFTGATGTWIVDAERGYGVADFDTALVCDVGSNLVHRKQLIDEGLYWKGVRIDAKTELLRSRNIWFRPVQLGDGPDGSIYVADMCREVIEHPHSLPPMIKKHLDLTSGRDQGRIWRLVSKSVPPAKTDDMSLLDDAALVERLASDIAWQRRMASQLLVERRQLLMELHGVESPASSHLLSLLEQSATESPQPEARILSLWLRFRLGTSLDREWALRLLQESHPRVLPHGIEMLGHTELVQALKAQLLEIALKTNTNRDEQDSRSYRVQLSLAKIANKLDETDRLELLATLMPGCDEPLVQAVIATSAGSASWKLLLANASSRWDDGEYSRWLKLMLPAWISKANNQPELAAFIQQSLATRHPRQRIWLTALAEQGENQPVGKLLHAIEAQSAIDAQVDSELERSPNEEGVAWLRLASPAVQTKWLNELLHPGTSESVQTNLIQALSHTDHPELIGRLIDEYRHMTPSLQSRSMTVITARNNRLSTLADALESGKIVRSQIDPRFRPRLMDVQDKALKDRFRAYLEDVPSERAETIRRYRERLESADFEKANIDEGRLVFQRSCAQCHRSGKDGLGYDVGPPLQSLIDKSPLQLLESILDPSREVDPKYIAYTLLTEDGVVVSGIIARESGSQIVVAEAEGKLTTLDRSSIEQIQSTGLSLMPNGLEEQVTQEQMVDLIQFLKSQ